MSACILLAISSCGLAQDVTKKDSFGLKQEAAKAGHIAAILKSREFYLNKKLSGPVERQAFCEVLFDNMKNASSEIEYPEPVVRTDDPKDPVFDKFQYCSSDEHVEANKGGTGYFFYLREIGTKGFRIYQLDLDNNPATEAEEIIYGESSRWLNASYGGYHSIIVDAEQGCRFREGIGVNISSKKLPDGQLAANDNAIVYYDGNTFIYELVELTGQQKNNEKNEYWLSVIKLSQGTAEGKLKGSYCNWSTINMN